MTASEIIEEIKRLPKPEQLRVAEFAREAVLNVRPLSPEKLGELAKRMVETTDPEEAGKLETEIMLGFYGEQSHA